LQLVGELQTLLAGGITSAVQVGNHLFAETIRLFGAVEVGVDFGVLALLVQRMVKECSISALYWGARPSRCSKLSSMKRWPLQFSKNFAL